MKYWKDDAGRGYCIQLERHDTLEEMAAMSGMTMEDLASAIEEIIKASREK